MILMKKAVFLLSLCLISTLVFTACDSSNTSGSSGSSSGGASEQPITPVQPPNIDIDDPEPNPPVSSSFDDYERYFSPDGKSWDIESYLRDTGMNYYVDNEGDGTNNVVIIWHPTSIHGNTQCYVDFRPRSLAVCAYEINDRIDFTRGIWVNSNFSDTWIIVTHSFFADWILELPTENRSKKYLMYTESNLEPIMILGNLCSQEQIPMLIQLIKKTQEMRIDVDALACVPHPFVGISSQLLLYSYGPINPVNIDEHGNRTPAYVD